MNEDRVLARIETRLIKDDPGLAGRMDALNGQLMALRDGGDRRWLLILAAAVIAMAGLLALGVTHSGPTLTELEEAPSSSASYTAGVQRPPSD